MNQQIAKGISGQVILVGIYDDEAKAQHAIEQLNKLCQLRVSVAIDDFGTGYFSPSYLH